MGNSRYCLTKADLADSIYAAIDIDKQKAAQVVEDYIELIKEALDKDAKVMLSGSPRSQSANTRDDYPACSSGS